MYSQEPFCYEIYTQSSPEKRQRFEVDFPDTVLEVCMYGETTISFNERTPAQIIQLEKASAEPGTINGSVSAVCCVARTHFEAERVRESGDLRARSTPVLEAEAEPALLH